MRNTVISRRYLIVPLVIGIFFILFYIIYGDIKKREIEEFNKVQLLIAETASKGISSFFKDYQASMIFLSQIKDIIEFNSDTHSLLENFYQKNSDYIEAITRVDSIGKILYTFPEDKTLIGKDISNQKHVQQVIETKKPVVSDVFLSVQGFYAIAMHVPIFYNDRYVGSLAILISIDQLGKLYLEKIKLKGTGNAWLLSENGIEIFCPVERHTGNSYLTNTKYNESAVKFNDVIKKKSTGNYKSVHEIKITKKGEAFVEKYMVFYRIPIGNTYWTIVMSYKEDDIYDSLTILRNRLSLVFFLLIVLMAYYFFSIAKVKKFIKEETKRKETEKNLIEKENKLHIIIESAMNGFCLINLKGEIIDVNETYCKMLGYTKKEFRSMQISDIENNASPEDIPKYIQIIVKKGKAKFESVHRKKDGSLLEVEVSVQYFDFGMGELVTFIQDISERKRYEKDLFEAKERAEISNKLKSAFLANISHEIRTPMNGILGFADLLKQKNLSGEKQQKYISVIEKSGNRMLNIINDIVDISKIESGQMTINLSEVNVNKVLEEIYEFFKLEANDKGLEFILENEVDEKDSIIKSDNDKLYAVLTNLVKNAIKYTQSGTIIFGAKINDSSIEFSVSDTGIGIPSDKILSVFDRFVQAEIEDKMARQGAGLGLAISKAYVQMLNGEIWVESEIGQGSTFYFTLPYK